MSLLAVLAILAVLVTALTLVILSHLSTLARLPSGGGSPSPGGRVCDGRGGQGVRPHSSQPPVNPARFSPRTMCGLRFIVSQNRPVRWFSIIATIGP